MHIDFIVPTKNALFDWSSFIDSQPFAKDLSVYPLLGIGWGDWSFYIDLDEWENLSVGIAANALLNPFTRTLIHITGYDELPSVKKNEKITISPNQYLHLCELMCQSFALNTEQQIDLLPNLGYTSNDNFYSAKGSYHALHTCNYWINKLLKKIGVRTSLWSPLDRGIFYQLDKMKKQAPTPPISLESI